MMSRRLIVTDWDDVPVIIDLPYLARLLGVTYDTAKRLCATGQIEAFKVGKQWRIARDAVMRHAGIL